MSSKLNCLSIKGFKSIKSLDGFYLRDLNVIIGANGAGKSNFIDFFRLLRAIIDGNLYEYIRQGGGISDFLFNGLKTTPEMEFLTLFGERGYKFKIKPGPLNNCYLAEEARYFENSRHGWWYLPGNSDDGISLLVKEALGNSKDSKYSLPVYDAIRSWQIYHFHDTSSSAAMRQYEIMQDNKKFRFNGSNIAPYLLRLKSNFPEYYKNIVDSIRLVMPFFDDFLLEAIEFGDKLKVNLSWKQKGSDYPMQPYHLSDGSIRFICLATALLQPDPPSTIIIDEPELGLHPEAIAILAELLQNMSNRTQVIIATQSAALVNFFSIDDLIVVNRKNGESTFERLNQNDFSEWLESYSIGELWTKNVIVGGTNYE